MVPQYLKGKPGHFQKWLLKSWYIKGGTKTTYFDNQMCRQASCHSHIRRRSNIATWDQFANVHSLCMDQHWTDAKINLFIHEAIFHTITNADGTAHTSNIPRNYQRRRYSAHKPLRDSQHLLFCISYMLQFYSTANITKQIPDRFLSTQCETKDKKKTLSSQTVGVGYGLIALLQRCERKLCRIKIGTFQRSEKVVGTPEYYRLKEEQSRGKRAEWELCSQE